MQGQKKFLWKNVDGSKDTALSAMAQLQWPLYQLVGSVNVQSIQCDQIRIAKCL